MNDQTDQTNGRRGFLKKLLGVIVAPKVAVNDIPVLKPRSVGASTMARDHAVDSLRYVMVRNYGTGFMEMYGYSVQGGESIQVEAMGKPGGTVLT